MFSSQFYFRSFTTNSLFRTHFLISSKLSSKVSTLERVSAIEPLSPEEYKASRTHNWIKKSQLKKNLKPVTFTREEDILFDHELFLSVLNLPTKNAVSFPQKGYNANRITVKQFFQNREKNEENFLIILRGLGKSKRFEELEIAIQYFKESGLEMTTKITNSIITSYGECQRDDLAEKIFFELREQKKKLKKDTYGAMMTAYVKNYKLEKAFDLFETMTLVDRVHADNINFSILMRGCILSRQYERALETFIQLQKVIRTGPDEVSYTLAISALSYLRRTERALQYFDDMKRKKLLPTEVTYTAVIRSCAVRLDYYPHMWKILHEMKESGFEPSLETYNAILFGVKNLGDIKAMESVMAEIIKRGFDIKLEQQILILSTLARSQKGSNILVIKENCLKADTFFQSYLFPSELEQTDQTENGVIFSPNLQGRKSGEGLSIYLKAGNSSWKQTQNQVQDLALRSRSNVPPRSLLNSYLNVFAEANMIDRCEQILGYFEEFQIPPDTITYTLMLKVYRSHGKTEKSIQLFEFIKKLDSNPNSEIKLVDGQMYHHLIKCLSKGNRVSRRRVCDIDNAMKYVREMYSQGFKVQFKTIQHLRDSTRQFPNIQKEIEDMTEKDPEAARLKRKSIPGLIPP